MSSYLTPKTIGIACGAVGMIAYCLYFDNKRRNDPNYREKVIARREREKKTREEQDEIQLPSDANDKVAMEKFFIKEIEIGEQLIQSGEIDRAVKHLSYAVVFCPQPTQLMAYMKEILPTDAYKKLVDSLENANKRVVETYNVKSKSPVEEDVE